jgi:sterol desaturase/sphingolipid hydroxylase (fatty acid hydroxylase superfamily)
MIIFPFLIGVAAWTLAEYLLHRFLGHVHRGRNFFKKEHLQHHVKANYFAPAHQKALSAIVVSVALFGIISLFIPYLAALAFIAGFSGMYGLYEVTHFRYHAKDPVARPFIILRKHHFYHHFHDPRTNHGVTTRIWDRVFGTFRRVEMVTVPSRMMMDWLLTDQEIKSIYAEHFQIAFRPEVQAALVSVD